MGGRRGWGTGRARGGGKLRRGAGAGGEAWRGRPLTGASLGPGVGSSVACDACIQYVHTLADHVEGQAVAVLAVALFTEVVLLAVEALEGTQAKA